MTVEYQINIEYTVEGQTEHLSYQFENAEARNRVYRTVCSELANDEVEMNYLRDNEGIILKTYNYSKPVKGEVAQIVPHSYFRIGVLDKMLEMVESKKINTTL
jgi:hypothetical protein